MHPKLRPSSDADREELLCPSCGGAFLHHDRVEVFQRDEDQTHGVHVLVEDDKVTIDTSLERNPSARRHGLVIGFWCETCNSRSTLDIAQHKGNTHVGVSLVKAA